MLGLLGAGLLAAGFLEVFGAGLLAAGFFAAGFFVADLAFAVFAFAIAAIVPRGYHPRVMAGYLRRVFALDLRSLAAMRIAVACAVLIDLFTRAVHLREHYSDDGVLPRETARSVSWLVDTSLLAISGSVIWVGIVFAIAIALALAVAIGWRTRITTVLLWLVMLSIQHRNPWLWDHRDALYSIALLNGMLLPWGAVWSFDARTPATTRYTGVPAAAYVLQIGAIYLFAALLKTGPEWRSDFTAVEHALGVGYWANPAAGVVVDHPSLAAILTIAVLAFEAGVLPLLLVPSRLARWFVVLGLVGLQLGFAVFLWLDTFPMIAAAMTLGLVPWSQSPPVAEPSRVRNGIALALILYVFSLNLWMGSTFAHRPAELFGVEQKWTMFAPAPSQLDGYFTIEARSGDRTSELLTHDQPRESMRDGVRTTRELVYLRRLLAMEPASRHAYAASRCTPEIDAITIRFEPTLAGERQPSELLVDHHCR